MSTVRELICDYSALNIQFDELTELQLTELTAEWLLDNCPGNPFDAKDFFFDGLAGNGDLIAPVLQAMAGHPNNNVDVMELIARGIREECKKPLEEYWDLIIEQIKAEAA